MAKQFVVATDEVWRLQNGSDPECRFFQEIANQGHYGGRPGTTRQGIYVCTPSGKLLDSTNTLQSERVLRMMETSLQAWGQLADEDRKLPVDSQIRPIHRWEDSYPSSGLVLTMFARDLPMSCDPGEKSRVKWNRDFVWFSSEEARLWIGPNPQPGDKHQVPPNLVARLVRFHLVDFVRGQTSPRTVEQVAGSMISTEVVQRKGNVVELKVRGKSVNEAPGLKLDRGSLSPRRRRRMQGLDESNGVQSQILGTATFDLSAEKFTAFEAVALGARWGRTRFNGRDWDREKSSPIGFVFQLASPTTPKVAPGFIAYYDAKWLKRPQGAATDKLK